MSHIFEGGHFVPRDAPSNSRRDDKDKTALEQAMEDADDAQAETPPPLFTPDPRENADIDWGSAGQDAALTFFGTGNPLAAVFTGATNVAGQVFRGAGGTRELTVEQEFPDPLGRNGGGEPDFDPEDFDPDEFELGGTGTPGLAPQPGQPGQPGQPAIDYSNLIGLYEQYKGSLPPGGPDKFATGDQRVGDPAAGAITGPVEGRQIGTWALIDTPFGQFTGSADYNQFLQFVKQTDPQAYQDLVAQGGGKPPLNVPGRDEALQAFDVFGRPFDLPETPQFGDINIGAGLAPPPAPPGLGELPPGLQRLVTDRAAAFQEVSQFYRDAAAKVTQQGKIREASNRVFDEGLKRLDRQESIAVGDVQAGMARNRLSGSRVAAASIADVAGRFEEQRGLLTAKRAEAEARSVFEELEMSTQLLGKAHEAELAGVQQEIDTVFKAFEAGTQQFAISADVFRTEAGVATAQGQIDLGLADLRRQMHQTASMLMTDTFNRRLDLAVKEAQSIRNAIFNDLASAREAKVKRLGIGTAAQTAEDISFLEGIRGFGQILFQPQPQGSSNLWGQASGWLSNMFGGQGIA
jgi:hypothetical protein